MECAPPSLVADHVRSPEKDATDFRKYQFDFSRLRYMNQSINIWSQHDALSSAVRAFFKGSIPAILNGSNGVG